MRIGWPEKLTLNKTAKGHNKQSARSLALKHCANVDRNQIFGPYIFVKIQIFCSISQIIKIS